ncbi:MAG: class I SAM-dependent methyltransferase [bacterium]
MRFRKSAREVFDAWARDYHADDMEAHHWPRVKQAFAMIPDMPGNYLEIGVGNGYGIYHMATHQFASGQCYAVDFSANMVERAKKKTAGLNNVHIQCANFLNWRPSEPVRFSFIFSMEVFYYFNDIQAGIERAQALLAPGGLLMVLVNFYKEHAASHAWPAQLDTPMQLWSEAEYFNAFERAGLKEIQQQHLLGHDKREEDGADPGTLATWGRRGSSATD